jgi:hypothetical protein
MTKIHWYNTNGSVKKELHQAFTTMLNDSVKKFGKVPFDFTGTYLIPCTDGVKRYLKFYNGRLI